jgi:hypothetical protein
MRSFTTVLLLGWAREAEERTHFSSFSLPAPGTISLLSPTRQSRQQFREVDAADIVEVYIDPVWSWPQQGVGQIADGLVINDLVHGNVPEKSARRMTSELWLTRPSPGLARLPADPVRALRLVGIK